MGSGEVLAEGLNDAGGNVASEMATGANAILELAERFSGPASGGGA